MVGLLGQKSFNQYWTGILRYINRGLTEGKLTADTAWDVHGVFLLCDKQEHPNRNYLSSVLPLRGRRS